MAIEQRSKEFNRNRILQLKSKSQNRSTDSTVDETVSVSASIMLEHSGDSLDDQLGANLSAEVGPNTSTVHEEEEEDDVATTVEMEPIFVCPKCSTVSEVEEQLRQQLEAAWATNAEKSKELSDAQNKIAELLEENAALKKAAQQKQKTFDEEKQRLEQQLVNKLKDEEIIAKLVPSKRFTRAQSSIQLLSSIPTTSCASTSQSTTGSMDETTVNGQVLLNTCNRSSSVSTIGENSSPPSLRSSSVFGIFAPVTNLWEDRSTSLVKSPSSSSSSLTGMPEEASSNGPEVEPSAVVEGTEVDSATVPMHGSEGDWLSPGFSESGPSPRGRTSCAVFDFPANTLKEQLIKLRLNISELKKCVDARHPTPTTATATATTNTTMIKGEGGDSIESRGVIHSMDSAKLAMK